MKVSTGRFTRGRLIILVAFTVCLLRAGGAYAVATPCAAPTQTVNFGPDQLGLVSGYCGYISLGVDASPDCDTTVTGFSVTGNNASEFSIVPDLCESEGPSCTDFTLEPGNYCTYGMEFTAAQTGARTATMQPDTTNGIQIGTSNFVGAGFELTSAQANPDATPDLILASPDPEATPIQTGYAALTFDSGAAPISWNAALKYQTSGNLPANPAQPLPAPTPFTSGLSPFTLAFGTPVPGASPAPDADFQVAGGIMPITGTYSPSSPAPAPSPDSDSFDLWITGTPISNSLLTSELTSAYTIPDANWNAGCTASVTPWSCCTGQGMGNCTPWTAECTGPSQPWSCCTGESAGNCASWNSVCTGPGEPSACCMMPGTQGYNYECATPDLFTLVAAKESSYAQFALTKNKVDGISGRWPVESPKTTEEPAGYAIGLMQAALTNSYDTPMETAWNWLDNVDAAYNIFVNKLGIVLKYQNGWLAANKNIPPLTMSQAEDMALWLYSGNGLSGQYMVPSDASGSWQWVSNQAPSNYVTYVRCEIPGKACNASCPCSAPTPTP